MKKKTFNWGIIGAGKIAGKFATDLATLPQARLYGVASRTQQKADDFAEKYGFEKGFASYEYLVNDSSVNVIYIATPHTLHYENTMLCLKAGKAVLCEKPLAMNRKQAKKMIKLAQKKQLFLMDALWTRCLSHFLKTQEIIESGRLGEVRSIKADFGFPADFDPNSRLFNPELGGGSLLDIGIYPVLLALAFLGKPDKITAASYMGTTGVDEDTSVFFLYKNGQTAHLHSTLRARTPTEAFIYCEKGYVHIPTRFHEPVSRITIVEYDTPQPQVIPFNYEVIGYQYEAQEVMDCLAAGRIESPLVPHQFSLDLLKVLDKIRKKIGLRYPADKG